MATLKINGLTKEQSNALSIGFEGFDELVDLINNYLKNKNIEQIEEVQEVYFDEYNEGDNEINL